jgi:3-methyladenine DNA glycosylase AlkD
VDIDARVSALANALGEQADADRAESMAAYMKGRFSFYGVQSRPRRSAQRPVFADWVPDGDELMAFAGACWERQEREMQYAACDLLRRDVGQLNASHVAGVERLIATRSWWDTVDALAAHVVGPLVTAHPRLVEDLDRWLVSGDLWLERAAILYQLDYKEQTDPDRLFDACLTHAGSTEFFHRKAIGWALRQYGRVAPDAVRRFVSSNEVTLSGLSKREALKHLA